VSAFKIDLELLRQFEKGLNPRFPGGVRGQAARLREEGHTILPRKGKTPPRIKNFERHLQQL